MPDPNSGDGWAVAATLSLLSLFGGAVAWLYGRKDRIEHKNERQVAAREAKLDAWHRELLARENVITEQQNAFQARVDRHLAQQDEKIADLEHDIEKYRVTTAVLAAAVARHDPDDPSLRQVASLLGAAWPMKTGDFDGSLDGLVDSIRRE